MTLSLTKTYAPAAGQQTVSASYNTDIKALFDAFNGISAQTSTLGGLLIQPTIDNETVLNVKNASGISILQVDTSNKCLRSYGTKLWQLIKESTITETADSITISGLSGNTDLEYYIEGHIKSYSTVYVGQIVLSCNSDTSASNYSTQYIKWTGSAHDNGLTTGPGGILVGNLYAGSAAYSNIRIYLTALSGRLRIALCASQAYYYSGPHYTYQGAGLWENTSDVISSLTISAQYQMATGSRIRLYARR